MRMHVFNSRLIPLMVLLVVFLSACSDMLKPEQTPERVVIHFLKEAGRGDMDGAREFVTPDSSGMVEQWTSLLYFPDISSPPTEEEAQKIDRFIGLFYRITPMNETETEADVHVVFAATDAIIDFPSMANDPLLPNVAQFKATLSREPAGENTDEGPWLIANFEPLRNP
jgi:hypothetical protein